MVEEALRGAEMDQDGRTRMRANFVQPQLKLQPQIPRPCVANGGKAKRLLEKRLGHAMLDLKSACKALEEPYRVRVPVGQRQAGPFFEV